MAIRMKQISLLFFCLILMGSFSLIMAPAADAEQGDKVVIVSIEMDKILEAHPAFKNAKEKFGTELEGMKKDLEKMDKNKQAESQLKMQQQLQQRGEQLQKEAVATVRQDIVKLAAQKGWDYVVDSNALLAGGRNVTDEVVQAMKQDQGKGQEKGKGKGADQGKGKK